MSNKESMNENNNMNNKNEEKLDKNLDINRNIEEKINTSKMYTDIKKAADSYFIDNHKDKSFFNNIGNPIFKIIIVLIFSLLLINFFQDKVSVNNKYSNIAGLWEDEYKNYYEIYGRTFEMNAGNPDVPFYEGTITNVIENDNGYTILIEGIKYNLNSDGTTSYDKKLDIVFKITEYSQEIETIMTANMGTENFDIVRLDKKEKTKR